MKRMHSGGCQCGKVRYEATFELGEVISCNCSRCGKLGSLLAFLPTSDFKLQSGKNVLTTYKFNKHVIDHQFCSVCGIQSFSSGKTPDGREMVALNVRCLDDVDLDALTIRKFDGRKL
jgi:hypothetical protein